MRYIVDSFGYTYFDGNIIISDTNTGIDSSYLLIYDTFSDKTTKFFLRQDDYCRSRKLSGVVNVSFTNSETAVITPLHSKLVDFIKTYDFDIVPTEVCNSWFWGSDNLFVDYSDLRDVYFWDIHRKEYKDVVHFLAYANNGFEDDFGFTIKFKDKTIIFTNKRLKSLLPSDNTVYCITDGAFRYKVCDMNDKFLFNCGEIGYEVLSYVAFNYGNYKGSSSMNYITAFDYNFMDCVEDFRVMKFSNLRPPTIPRKALTVEVNSFRTVDVHSSCYMLYLDQMPYTVSYAILSVLASFGVDLVTLASCRLLCIKGKDDGFLVEFNDNFSQYIRKITKLSMMFDGDISKYYSSIIERVKKQCIE